MAKYVTHAELVVVFTECKAQCTLTPRMIAIITEIVSGLIGRFNWRVDQDDAFQECCLKVLNKLGNVDTSRNPFGWLTSVCHNELKSQQHKHNRYIKLKRDALRSQGGGLSDEVQFPSNPPRCMRRNKRRNEGHQ